MDSFSIKTRMIPASWQMIAVLFLAALLVACGKPAEKTSTEETTPQGPALWRVSDDDSTIWLFGTFHLLPEDADWRRDAIDNAFQSSNKLVLEADVEGVDQEQLVHLLQTYAVNGEGKTLSGRLTADQLSSFQDLTDSLNVPIRSIDHFEPWYASTFLTIQFMAMKGFDQTRGVEAQLHAEAESAGKRFAYLETVEEQLRFFADMPEDAQLTMLSATIDELGDTGDMLEDMKNAWLSGDLDALATLINGSIAEIPDLYEVIMTRRNRAWAEEIEDMVKHDAGEVFIAVGAGHLVGEDSVIDLLKERGVEAERM